MELDLSTAAMLKGHSVLIRSADDVSGRARLALTLVSFRMYVASMSLCVCITQCFSTLGLQPLVESSGMCSNSLWLANWWSPTP